MTFVCLNAFLPPFSASEKYLYFTLTASFLSLPLNWTAFSVGELFMLPTAAIYARRLHDANLSAFWLIAVAVPVFFAHIFTVFAVFVAGAFMREADDQTMQGALALLVAPAIILESLIFLAFLLVPPSRETNKYGAPISTIGQR